MRFRFLPPGLSWKLLVRCALWPVLFGCLVIALSIYAYWHLDLRQQAELRAHTMSHAAEVSTAIKTDLGAREAALRRLTQRWATSGGMSKKRFLQEAKMIYDDFPGFQVVEWIDSSHIVRWAHPLVGNEAVIGMQSAFESKRLMALKHSRNSGKPVVTGVIELVQGGPGFLLYTPTYVQDVNGQRLFHGFVLAVFRISDWIEHLLAARADPHEYLGVKIGLGGEQVFAQDLGPIEAEQLWPATQETKFYGQLLEVTIYPPEACVRSYLSHWPRWVLIAGVLLAIKLMLFMVLWRYSSRMALISANTRQRLEREVEARAEAEKALHRMAHYDELTELPKRRLLDQKLAATIKSQAEHGGKFALAYLDIDGFKRANDEYGHPAGDKLLQLIGRRLTAMVRNFDTVARVGGDEFLVLISEVENSEAALIAANRLRQSIDDIDCVVCDGISCKLSISASVGVAIFPDHAGNAADLIEAADRAMYESKKDGKNRCTLASNV